MTFINVKIPLQCLVNNSQIIVHTSFKVKLLFRSPSQQYRFFFLSQHELPGFYDPAIGENKVLKVQFKYKNDIKTVVIEDKDEIKLPLTK
jgi:Domain of unknown function (DUF3395)